MITTSGIPLSPRSLSDFVQRHGGIVKNDAHGVVRRLVPVQRAAAGDLAPLLGARYVEDAFAAVARGAFLLIDEALAERPDVVTLPGWFHPFATWALAELLDVGDAPADDPIVGDGCKIGRGVVLMPRVRLGARVTIGAGAIIGEAGFGFASGPNGATRAIPHLGGVVIEDDVHIGALCTISAGTISPTVIRRGAKLDAQVHVGHNCEIGEGTVIAAQSGLAGSVVIGRGVMMGGQVGVADHVSIGDGARIAAKSGVIGDVAARSTVAGYPAVERQRWLRGLAELYKLASSRSAGTSSLAPSSGSMRVPSGFSSPPPPVASSASNAPSSVRPEAIIRRSEPPSGRGSSDVDGGE
ncbi:MAG: UDP-3-O-[3-hydroxymyristoyl] glucosamine N-acyltransferase [Myxococcales bacterium]|nr:UDP-3-O-[3-hydroxymyristoyl] glucosamine N-acyltransferase [Myxococcales bacterium]